MSKNKTVQKRYERKKPEELRRLFQFQAAAYLDYRSYVDSLQDVMEKADESFEVYEPENWMNACMNLSDSGDRQMQKVMETLNAAEKAMHQVMQREKNRLVAFLKYLLSQDAELQVRVFGDSFGSVDAKKLIQKVMKSDLLEKAYGYSVEISSGHLISVMKDEYEKMIEEAKEEKG